MTESEAIEWIKELKGSEEIQEFYYVESFIEAFDIAIQALEKQIPKYLHGIKNLLYVLAVMVKVYLISRNIAIIAVRD